MNEKDLETIINIYHEERIASEYPNGEIEKHGRKAIALENMIKEYKEMAGKNI